jgi:cytochrome c-type biogenesis protein CcmH/NrfF
MAICPLAASRLGEEKALLWVLPLVAVLIEGALL